MAASIPSGSSEPLNCHIITYTSSTKPNSLDKRVSFISSEAIPYSRAFVDSSRGNRLLAKAAYLKMDAAGKVMGVQSYGRKWKLSNKCTAGLLAFPVFGWSALAYYAIDYFTQNRNERSEDANFCVSTENLSNKCEVPAISVESLTALQDTRDEFMFSPREALQILQIRQQTLDYIDQAKRERVSFEGRVIHVKQKMVSGNLPHNINLMIHPELGDLYIRFKHKVVGTGGSKQVRPIIKITKDGIIDDSLVEIRTKKGYARKTAAIEEALTFEDAFAANIQHIASKDARSRYIMTPGELVAFRGRSKGGVDKSLIISRLAKSNYLNELNALSRNPSAKGALKNLIYLLQAMKGVAYLHANDLVHRDIKPDNMLIDKQGVCVMSDLADVIIADDRKLPRSKCAGTPQYCDILARDRGIQGKPEDIFSFGRTLLHISSCFHNVPEKAFLLDAFQKVIVRCCDPKRENRPKIDTLISEFGELISKYASKVGLAITTEGG